MCGGEASMPGKKTCPWCIREISAANIARHRNTCSNRPQDAPEDPGPAPQPQGQCCDCGAPLLVANIARLKERSCPMPRAVL